MAPLSWGLEVVGKSVVKSLPHADDPVRHTLHLALPLGVEGLVAEDGAGDTRTMERRVRVHGADDNLQLTVHTRLLLGAGGDEGESTDTLSVETHVLSERLGEGDLVTLRDEVPQSEGVAAGGAGGEALVGHVKEGEELALLDDVGDLLPLLLGGVNTGGVVGARVEQDDGLLWGSLGGGQTSRS